MPNQNKLQSRQTINPSALSMTGSAANDSLDTILSKIDAEAAKLFEDRNILLTGGGLITNTGGSSLAFTANFVLYINSNIAGAAPYTITIPVAGSPWTFTADGRMAYVTITSRSAGTFTLTTDVASLPAVTSANQEIILIAKRVGTDVFFRNGAAVASSQSRTLVTPAVPTDQSYEFSNGTLSASVATNALTVNLLDKNGATASATSPVRIGFRSSTATSGLYLTRSVIAALSIVIPSGTSIGTVNGVAEKIYVYAIDNAGTVELALSLSKFDEGTLQNTTAISGGASRSGLYSTTARTGVAIRLIGRITATEATAGTWVTSPSEITPLEPSLLVDNKTNLWMTGRNYEVGEIVEYNTYSVRCLTKHTSGTWATDINNNYWEMTAEAKNNLINSAFDVYQRSSGASLALANTPTYLCVDRFWLYRAGSSAAGQSVAAGDISLTGMIISRPAADTATGFIYSGQTIETLNVSKLAGKQVTVSYYAKAGANFSSSGNALACYVTTGAGTNQGTNGTINQTWTTWVLQVNQSVTLTTTMTRYQATFTVPAGTKEIAVYWAYAPTGTAGANDWFQLEQVMLSEGPVAPKFQTAGRNFEEEIAMCQRYYEKAFNLFTAPAAGVAPGRVKFHNMSAGATDTTTNIQFKVTKFSTPTMTQYQAAGGTANCLFDNFSDQGGNMYVSVFGAGSISFNHWTAEAEI